MADLALPASMSPARAGVDANNRIEANAKMSDFI
jgi:hypothetical protein